LTNYDDLNSAADLAKYVASFHWRQLSHILENDFKGIELPKEDKKKSYSKNKTQFFPLTGARVLQVKGSGTQLLWDSRKVWLPSSQIKKLGAALQIPLWLAQKNNMA
jgi:hypothetical protein